MSALAQGALAANHPFAGCLGVLAVLFLLIALSVYVAIRFIPPEDK